VNEPLLHYEVHGDRGPFVLLVHGFLSSRAQWLPNLDALATIGRPVVVELFGHGRSPSPDDPACYTPQSYVEEFERIRAALGADRWLVIGQSLGAALTLRYALDHPQRLIAHVFTNSTSSLAEDEWGEMVRPAMEAQAQRLRELGRAALDEHPLNPTRGKNQPPDVLAAFREDVLLLDPLGIANTGTHTIPDSSVRSRASENTVPTLLVVGEREGRFVPHRHFAEAHMPNLEVVGLDGGHAVNIDAAAAFNQAVVEFFNRYV
jgi:pimeloyl-ACP methyl ester carboxylesterase